MDVSRWIVLFSLIVASFTSTSYGMWKSLKDQNSGITCQQEKKEKKKKKKKWKKVKFNFGTTYVEVDSDEDKESTQIEEVKKGR